MSQLWAVTGATGFIGRNLVAALTQRGFHVRPFGGRITDDAALRELVRGADFVVHLAAYVHKRVETADERSECHATNVAGTRQLIEAIVEAGRNAFLVFISTANVYPTSDAPVDENTPPAPKTYYGKTKLEGERLVLDSVAAGTLRAAILRPAMVFGEDAPGNLGRLMSLVRRRVVPLFAGGANQKSIVPVEMLIEAIVGVAGRDDCNGAVLNVGGAALSMRRIADVLADALGVRPIRVPLPTRVFSVAASAIDAMATRTGLRVPALRQLVDTYASSAVVSDRKLRVLVPLGGEAEVEAALRRCAR